MSQISRKIKRLDSKRTRVNGNFLMSLVEAEDPSSPPQLSAYSSENIPISPRPLLEIPKKVRKYHDQRGNSRHGAVFDASEVEIGEPPKEVNLDAIPIEEELVLHGLRGAGIDYRHSQEEMLSHYGMHIASPEGEAEENARFTRQEYHFK